MLCQIGWKEEYMNMNNRCGTCNMNPCQCHTVCKPPVVCMPVALSRRPKSATVSVEGLLDLIEAKCDKRTCEVLQVEISLLFVLLGLEAHRPTPPVVTPPGTVPPVVTPPVVTPPITKPLPDLAFQLVSNMVDSLSGDVKEKYPSAALMKKELQSLWSCIYGKQQHHGEWDANFVERTVQPDEDEQCLSDGDDSVPKTIKITVPVDAGSTVFNTIDGRRCLYESLVDNNTEEPNKLTVLQGKWMSYCDLKDTIDCVLPRRILVDCHDACDDPDGDGVIEDKTMCERMEAVEAYMKAHP